MTREQLHALSLRDRVRWTRDTVVEGRVTEIGRVHGVTTVVISWDDGTASSIHWLDERVRYIEAVAA